MRLTYSSALGWWRTMCIIRPGGYNGWCIVKAIVLSAGWVLAERAESRSCKWKNKRFKIITNYFFLHFTIGGKSIYKLIVPFVKYTYVYSGPYEYFSLSIIMIAQQRPYLPYAQWGTNLAQKLTKYKKKTNRSIILPGLHTSVLPN